MVIGMANLAMATGNLGRDGAGVNPLRGQNNVQGSCDMGSFPHELPGYRHVSDDTVRGMFEMDLARAVEAEPGLRIPNMFDAALDGTYKGCMSRAKTSRSPIRIRSHVDSRPGGIGPASLFTTCSSTRPRSSPTFSCRARFLEKDGTFTNAERRIKRVRPGDDARTGSTNGRSTARSPKPWAIRWPTTIQPNNGRDRPP